MKSSVSVITTKIPHHSAHSGYEQLINYLPESIRIHFVRRGHATSVFTRLIEGSLRLLTTSRWYQWDGVLADIISFKQLLKKNSVVHYLYGDSSIGLLPYIHRFLPGKLVLTIHACPSDFNEVMQYPHLLREIDAFILLGTNQKSLLRAYGIPESKLHLIPHGVDLSYFKPILHKPRLADLQILLVGNWRRNFALYATVIQACSDKPVVFHIITQPFNYHYFRGLSNVRLYSGISDESLRTMYQLSDVLLMGMEDAVANNVLLEAAACGLPVICERVGAVAEYFNDSEITFVEPNSPAVVVEMLERLIEDRDGLQQMAERAYHRVKEYDWHEIAKKTQKVYDSIYLFK